MRLKAVILENFRSYRVRTEIPIEEELTAFIGKNDAGKSTVLEALEIFFNSEQVKIESADASVGGDASNVRIGCVFTDLPAEIVLDASAKTTLADEYLLNANSCLEIHKVFNCALATARPKEVVARCQHPSTTGYNDLLNLKQTDLKKRIKDLGIELSDEVDQRVNARLRQAIWRNASRLELQPTDVSLDKEDGKQIWEEVKKALPVYALFKSDRPSTDQDSEVQDPMKFAVQEALAAVQEELRKVSEQVAERVSGISQRTLEKLQEIDPDLASTLNPQFRPPNFTGLFKFSLTGDDDIPINKRGSGVRRLILLSFFRAQAERRREQDKSPTIIYAVEEPETSQHPNYQRVIVEALLELTASDSAQVLLTTHVPGLAGLLPLESLRFIDKDGERNNRVRVGDDSVYDEIAGTLGLDPTAKTVKVVFCVEGKNDVQFFKHISAMLNAQNSAIPNIETDPRIVCIPLGGSSLLDWVNERYLRRFRLPEYHIYDRDVPKYQTACDEVNVRGDGSRARRTSKREIENYLHPDAINEVLGVSVTFGDEDDVPAMVARAVTSSAGSRPMNPERAKLYLNDRVAQRMTYERLCQSDTKEEIVGWLGEIAEMCEE